MSRNRLKAINAICRTIVLLATLACFTFVATQAIDATRCEQPANAQTASINVPLHVSREIWLKSGCRKNN